MSIREMVVNFQEFVGDILMKLNLIIGYFWTDRHPWVVYYIRETKD